MILNRILLGLTLIVLANGVMAQNSAVTNASMSLKSAKENLASQDFEEAAKDLAEAAGYIEPATTHEKTMASEKTWRYRGDIYQLISRNLDKPSYSAIDDNPVMKAAESYKKALQYDKKGSYEKENKLGLATMQNLAVNAGIEKFNASEFTQAYQLFDNASILAETLGMVDTLACFNAALAADRSGDDDNALKYYRKLIDMDYKEPNLYKFMYDAYTRKGDEAAASAVLSEGLEKYPTDQGLLIDQVNISLNNGDMESAVTLLEKTIEQDPSNPELQYSVGTVYDNLGKTTEARAAYLKAIELNGEYFEAQYNLGASYFNDGVEKVKSCNDIPANKIKEYDACKAAADVVFNQALPYLEKAHEIDSGDSSTIASLVEIYTRTKQLDKAKAMREKLNKD